MYEIRDWHPWTTEKNPHLQAIFKEVACCPNLQDYDVCVVFVHEEYTYIIRRLSDGVMVSLSAPQSEKDYDYHVRMMIHFLSKDESEDIWR